MKRMFSVCLVIIFLTVIFSSCGENRDRSIYSYGVEIEKSDNLLYGEVECFEIENKILVSALSVSKWENDPATSCIFYISVFDEYDINNYYDEHCVRFNTELFECNYMMNSVLDSGGDENDPEYLKYKVRAEECERAISERENLLKVQKSDDLIRHFKALDVEYSLTSVMIGNVMTSVFEAELNYEQVLSFLDTRFVYIEIADSEELSLPALNLYTPPGSFPFSP